MLFHCLLPGGMTIFFSCHSRRSCTTSQLNPTKPQMPNPSILPLGHSFPYQGYLTSSVLVQSHCFRPVPHKFRRLRGLCAKFSIKVCGFATLFFRFSNPFGMLRLRYTKMMHSQPHQIVLQGRLQTTLQSLKSLQIIVHGLIIPSS